MKPTVVFPGADGGGNWGSGAADPKLGYFFLNAKADGAISHMTKSAGDEKQNGLGENQSQSAYNRMGVRGPNGRTIGSLSNPQTGWPCNAPPWGELRPSTTTR